MNTTIENQAARGDSLQRAGSEVPTPRTNEEVRLCRVKSSSFGDMVGADFAQKLERENRALREGCAKIAASIGNGSAISPDASVDFLTNALACEVKLYCAAQRAETEYLREQVKRAAGLPNSPAHRRRTEDSEQP